MPKPDMERFRLRWFAELLVQSGECEVHESQVDLIDVATILDGNSKAVWFKRVGGEGAELIGNVMGSRKRLAQALGTDEKKFAANLRNRFARSFAPIEVSPQDAPVHQVVLSGEDADMSRLPVHLQHEMDGAPYISASIDFSRDPASGFTNIGCRRMMLRGPRTAGIDLNAPSDLRMIYESVIARGERMPVAFTIGNHPADFLAGVASAAADDEFHVMGAIRGEPVPIVKCVSIDVQVPADAEYVLEGYLDASGLSEPEGPYGEYLGYYGEVKKNPVFHLTAVTHRADALFQTVTIGGRYLDSTDTANIVAAKTEATVWEALRTAIRYPVAVCCTASCGGMYNVRVSMRQRYPGEARNAIAAVFASLGDVKHVHVVDDDIDVYSDAQIDWAMATRFQADRDLVVASDFRTVPIDPSLTGARTGAKAGFDCTKPLGASRGLGYAIPEPPKLPKSKPGTVLERLNEGPASFLELMAAVGTRDGRELLHLLDELYRAGRLNRHEDGRYALTGNK